MSISSGPAYASRTSFSVLEPEVVPLPGSGSRAPARPARACLLHRVLVHGGCAALQRVFPPAAAPSRCSCWSASAGAHSPLQSACGWHEATAAALGDLWALLRAPFAVPRAVILC